VLKHPRTPAFRVDAFVNGLHSVVVGVAQLTTYPAVLVAVVEARLLLAVFTDSEPWRKWPLAVLDEPVSLDE
jgi:hypothetical protein